MKNLGVFAIGMCLGLIFGAAISGDVYHSTTYMIDKGIAFPSMRWIRRCSSMKTNETMEKILRWL